MDDESIRRKNLRSQTMAEALASNDFYNPKPLLEKNGDINVIWGQRSNGKTYAFLKNALETYKTNKRTFVYVRRWAEDIVVKNMAKLFDPLPVEKIFGKNKSIQFFRGAFRLVDTENEDEMPQVIGWAVALNQVAHTKSQTFVNVKNVILDEFLQMKTERVLRDEFDAWEQTLSTILRTINDAKIFIIGNSVSKYSPYFTPYGIDPNKMVQGEIKEIMLQNEYGEPTKVVAEWCEYNSKVGQRTSKYVRGSRMAKTGEWEINDVAEIPHTDNEEATEKLLCSMFDFVLNINLGIFLRYSKWTTLETDCGIYKAVPHYREFLVVRETPKQSKFYHLTNIKDLSYSRYCDINKMFNDIKEECEIDIMDELKMGRVYAENMFTADYFTKTYRNYLGVTVKDLI